MTTATKAPTGGAAGALALADRLYSRIEDWLNMIGASIVFGLMVFVCAEVVMRTAFNKSIYGFIDTVELTMASFAFLGAAHCQRLGGHIRMDLAVGALHGRALWLAECTSTFVALVVVTFLIDGSWAHFMRAFQIGDTTIDAELPTWPSKLLAPTGLTFLWIRLALNVLGYARLIRYPDAEPISIPPKPGAHFTPESEKDARA